jgi:hypothetical protein
MKLIHSSSLLFLQWQIHFIVAAMIVSGAYKLATSVDQKPPMTGEQAVKFSNYFMSRRSVQLPKGSYSLLEVLHTLTSNKVFTQQGLRKGRKHTVYTVFIHLY